MPSEIPWGNWQDDLDTANAYRVLHGKAINEIEALFAENPIEIAECLRFAPCQVAVPYLRGCIDYLTSEASKDNADAASSLIRLTLEMVRKCPREVFASAPAFLKSLRFVAERQSFYGADPKVYGSFLDFFSDIKASLEEKDA